MKRDTKKGDSRKTKHYEWHKKAIKINEKRKNLLITTKESFTCKFWERTSVKVGEIIPASVIPMS